MSSSRDLPRRRSLLLVRPLPRARREHRARARGHAHAGLDAELPPTQCWRPRGHRLRRAVRRLRRALGDGAAGMGERRPALHDVGRGEPRSRSALDLRRARERALDPRGAEPRDLGGDERALPVVRERRGARRSTSSDRDGFYRSIRRATQLSLGLLRSTMLHDAPLDFMWLGVLLERVGQTARMLDVHHHVFTQPAEPAARSWRPRCGSRCSRACSGFEAFMKRSQGRVTGDAVARVPASSRPLPALDALLRALGAGPHQAPPLRARRRYILTARKRLD